MPLDGQSLKFWLLPWKLPESDDDPYEHALACASRSAPANVKTQQNSLLYGFTHCAATLAEDGLRFADELADHGIRADGHGAHHPRTHVLLARNRRVIFVRFPIEGKYIAVLQMNSPPAPQAIRFGAAALDLILLQAISQRPFFMSKDGPEREPGNLAASVPDAVDTTLTQLLEGGEETKRKLALNIGLSLDWLEEHFADLSFCVPPTPFPDVEHQQLCDRFVDQAFQPSFALSPLAISCDVTKWAECGRGLIVWHKGHSVRSNAQPKVHYLMTMLARRHDLLEAPDTKLNGGVNRTSVGEEAVVLDVSASPLLNSVDSQAKEDPSSAQTEKKKQRTMLVMVVSKGTCIATLVEESNAPYVGLPLETVIDGLTKATRATHMVAQAAEQRQSAVSTTPLGSSVALSVPVSDALADKGLYVLTGCWLSPCGSFFHSRDFASPDEWVRRGLRKVADPHVLTSTTAARKSVLDTVAAHARAGFLDFAWSALRNVRRVCRRQKLREGLYGNTTATVSSKFRKRITIGGAEGAVPTGEKTDVTFFMIATAARGSNASSPSYVATLVACNEERFDSFSHARRIPVILGV